MKHQDQEGTAKTQGDFNINDPRNYSLLIQSLEILFGNDSNNFKKKLAIATDNNIEDLYKEADAAYKKNAKQFHPDKNVNKPEAEQLNAEAKFKLINSANEYIGQYFNHYTEINQSNDVNTRKFKTSEDESDFKNFASGNLQQSQSSARNSNGSHSSSFIFSEPSFDELAKTINWGEVFKPEPPIKPSWLASVDDSGNLVVINSEGKKDKNSKILEKAMWHISEQNASVNDRFEISSKTISGVIVIISNEEMKQKIAQNGGIKEDNKKDQESIIAPLDLGITSSGKMIGKHEEKSLEVAVVKSPQGSWTSRIESKDKGEKGSPRR